MTILVVDDEAAQRRILSGYLKKQGHVLLEASGRTEAVEVYRTHAVDVVLSDYRMPDGTGLDLLRELRRLDAEARVIVLTAFGTIERAVTAMREGAFDYLTKPINLDELDVLLRRADELQRLTSENALLREQAAERASFEGIVSQSAAMERVLNMAARVAQSSATVLIRGESGTGKELIARAIHYASDRAAEPFVGVNCASLNEQLLESELFGHEKGAFTGADKQRRGRFERANGGTILLDEIGDISPGTQVRLLRILQERQFERVGGSDPIQVDVRVIAATNRDLEQAIKQGSFREDLFYRLNVVSIEIPPLRERREDIAPLLEQFLSVYREANRRGNLSFSREAWGLLLRHEYPGNIRELQNIVQRAVIMSRGEHIVIDDLPHVLRLLPEDAPPVPARVPLSFDEQVEQLQKDLIFEALRIHGNNQSQAARQLGLSERNLRYRLKKWGVK